MGIAAGPAGAQTPQVRVCALDARNDGPLAGATVRLSADAVALSATTGSDGCAWITGSFPVSIEDPVPGVVDLRIGVPYPNPAGSRAWLPVVAGLPLNGTLDIFDAIGREVISPLPVSIPIGEQHIELPVASLRRGTYFARLSTDAGTAVRSIVVGGEGQPAGPVGRLATAPASPAVLMDEGVVRIEIERDGFVAAVEERVVKNNETVRRALLKITENKVPMIDMKGLAYRGFQGGLYADGTNEMPEAHRLAGLAAARSIEPLDINGKPDPNGVYILTSIGMSNTSDEFCGVADPNNPCKIGTFMNRAGLDPEIDHTNFVLIDGADPGKTAEKWVDSGLSDYRRILDEELNPFGYSEKQVQIAWIKLANAPPSGTLPDAGADAFRLQEQFGQVARAMKERYPNLKMIFFSSRIYAGYATTDRNPEPYAYEQGFAVKWTVNAQIRQMETGEMDPVSGDLDLNTVAPWIGWGPYMWADGTNPRSDGLVWTKEDFKDDGVHPAKPGIEKVADMLLDFFKSSPLTSCWVLAGSDC
ncbi:MAG: T9SS type A sorting domain-containing protein [Rhodothermales bacterium]